MTNPTIEAVREAMRALAKQVDVLPAVGGALQEEERPDADERVEQILGGNEKLFEANWETNAKDLCRPLQPIPRTQWHLYRYFQDGSYRSYFLGNLLEHDRETPVLFAQIGACQIERNDDGSVKPVRREVKPYLLLAMDAVSEGVQETLLQTAHAKGVEVVNLARNGRADPEPHARLAPAGAKQGALQNARVGGTVGAGAIDSPEQRRMARSGRLAAMFANVAESSMSANDPKSTRLIGVAKNFRKDPQFAVGRRARSRNGTALHRLLAKLDTWHRTTVFGAREGKVAVLVSCACAPKGQIDYPLMGVIKVELINPSKKPVDSALIDQLSGALIAERNATPHGVDRALARPPLPDFPRRTLCAKSSLEP
ncbi:MAG: hypothetical protein KatS3mg018_1576 [Fimbriimonadales bacterium]|nr:MAG: hypothetical protein KatS3mg018_1576 [Fimbriimonadales bacterium]